jgi:hypothetical protein
MSLCFYVFGNAPFSHKKMIAVTTSLSSRSRQPSKVRWIHRCSAYLSPNHTGGDCDCRDDGGNNGSIGNGNDDHGNANDTAVPVPVQTWNKSPIVSVSRCLHSMFW